MIFSVLKNFVMLCLHMNLQRKQSSYYRDMLFLKLHETGRVTKRKQKFANTANFARPYLGNRK